MNAFEAAGPLVGVAALAVALCSAFLLGYTLPVTGSQATLWAPAIADNGSGIIVPFTLTLRPGGGRLLVNVESTFYSTDSEASLKIARVNAENYLGASLSGYDLELDSRSSVASVSGESATALLSAGIVSAYTGQPILPYATASATINADGTLGPVDGVEEKILAATLAGKTVFVVSEDQVVRNSAQLEERIAIVRVRTDLQAIRVLLDANPG